MVKSFHNLGLTHCIFDLVVGDEVLLFHDFHCIDLPIVSLSALKDPAERSFSDYFKKFKVLETDKLSIKHNLLLFLKPIVGICQARHRRNRPLLPLDRAFRRLKLLIPRAAWLRLLPQELLQLQKILLFIINLSNLLGHKLDLHFLNETILIRKLNDLIQLEAYLLRQLILIVDHKLFQAAKPLIEGHGLLDVRLPLPQLL